MCFALSISFQFYVQNVVIVIYCIEPTKSNLALPVVPFSLTAVWPGTISKTQIVKDINLLLVYLMSKNKRKIGSREEDEVSGFFVLSHLWIRGYFRLG